MKLVGSYKCYRLEEPINLENTIQALLSFSDMAPNRSVEHLRLARVMVALLVASDGPEWLGVARRSEFQNMQFPDGGWSDPEETAWVVSVLSPIIGGGSEVVIKARRWLESVRRMGGGWGRHPRDQARIPTTALVLALVPSVATDADRAWVRQAWKNDLNSPVHLSYKGGFYLLTVVKEEGKEVDSLVLRTVAYLAEDQNDDGGFGPWRNHPIGSDPWSTGVVLWGLSKWIDYVDQGVVEKALGWLERTQLPSGYWPYHFLDEGTSYALIGAVSALRAMENRK